MADGAVGAPRAAPLSLRGHGGPGAGVGEACLCLRPHLIAQGQYLFCGQL